MFLQKLVSRKLHKAVFLKKILVIQNNEDGIRRIDTLLPEDEFEIFYSHNIKDGLEISLRYFPDLILLCIKDDTGISDLLQRLNEEEKTCLIPLIVISENNSTALMRKVMELGADDYLPAEMIDSSLLIAVNKRFNKITRLKEIISNQINSLEGGNGKHQNDDHILVKIGNRLKLIKFNEIICITAMKEYSKIRTKDDCKIIVRKSLKNWISILPTVSFLQIHRGTIINIDYIEKIIKTNDRTYTVHLKYISETFDFSHRYANVMRHTFPTG